jgi:esterase/lipase superfamily enzyme
LVQKGIRGARYAGVPIALLSAIVEVFDKHRSRRAATLYRDCKTILHQKTIPTITFEKAIRYFEADKSVTRQSGIVKRARHWKRSRLVNSLRGYHVEISRGRRVARKVVRKSTWTGTTPRSSARKEWLRAIRPGGEDYLFHLGILLDEYDITKVWGLQPRQKRIYRQTEAERYEVEIYWATDREPDAAGAFTNSGNHAALQRGKATVSFPAKHRVGHLDEPQWEIEKVIAPKNYSNVDSITKNTRQAFHKSLTSDLGKFEDRLFVFVHGFNTTFDQSLKRTAQILLDSNFPGSALAFSWPSRADAKLYVTDHDRIPKASSVLAAFLQELRKEHPNTAIHVVAHSMGAEISTRALTSLASFDASEVVLQAPDMSTIDYPDLARALKIRARRITVYANTNDIALVGSAELRKVLSGGTLTRVGQDVLQAMHPDVDAVDATGLGARVFLSHSYAFKREFIIDLRETRESMPQLRAQLEELTVTGGRYYRFRP